MARVDLYRIEFTTEEIGMHYIWSRGDMDMYIKGFHDHTPMLIGQMVIDWFHGLNKSSDILLQYWCVYAHGPESMVLTPMTTLTSAKPIYIPPIKFTKNSSIKTTKRPQFWQLHKNHVWLPEQITIKLQHENSTQITQRGNTWKKSYTTYYDPIKHPLNCLNKST